MAGAYTDAELAKLERVGQRRSAEARMDICQRHLTEFHGGGR